MAKKESTEQSQTEVTFAVTLDEFLTGIPKAQVETKAGFKHLCQREGIAGKQTAAQWQAMYQLYQTKPIKKTWAEHLKEGRK